MATTHTTARGWAGLLLALGVTATTLVGCGGGNSGSRQATAAPDAPDAQTLAVTTASPDLPDTATDTGDDAPEVGRVRPLHGYFWTTATSSATEAPVFHRAQPLWFDVADGPALDERLPVANYAVRWAAGLRFPVAGDYQFRLSVGKHDKVRMQFVNDTPISLRPPIIPDLFNVQTGAAGGVFTASRTRYAANTVEPFTVDLTDTGDGARLQLEWKTPGSADFVRVPTSAFVTAGLAAPRRIGPRVLPVALDALVLSPQGLQFSIRDGAASLGFRTAVTVASADPRLGITPSVSIAGRPGPADPAVDPMVWPVTLNSFLLRTLGDYPVTLAFTNVVGQRSTLNMVVRVTPPAPWPVLTGGRFLMDVSSSPSGVLVPADKATSAWQGEDRWEFLRTALLVSASAPNAVNAGLPAPADRDGSMVGLQFNGAIRQRLWVAPGDQLSFSATQRLNDSAGDQPIGVFVDGVRQGPPILPPRGTWGRHTVTLQSSTSGGHYLELRGLSKPGGGDRTALVDDIEVTQGPGWTTIDGRNGSFESPALPDGDTLHLVGPGDTAQWGGTAGSVLDIAAPNSPFTAGTPLPPDGRQVAALFLDASAIGLRLPLQPGDTLLFAATQGQGSSSDPDYCRARALSVLLDGLYQGAYQPTAVGTFSFNREAFMPPKGAWQAYAVPLWLDAAREGTLQLTVGGGMYGCNPVTLVDQLRIRRLR